MTVTLVPLGSRLLVHPIPFEEKIGSLYAPNRREYAIKARVLSIGPEVRDIEAGMVILVPALCGQAVGDERMIHESNVLGIA